MKLIWDLAVELNAHTDPTSSETINICHNIYYCQITLLLPVQLSVEGTHLETGRNVLGSIALPMVCSLRILAPNNHFIIIRSSIIFPNVEDTTVPRWSFRLSSIHVSSEVVVDLLEKYLLQLLSYWYYFTFAEPLSLVAKRLKCLPLMRETWVSSLGREDPLEKEMATHSSILAWRIPWTEDPGGLQSMGSQRVGHDWAN